MLSNRSARVRLPGRSCVESSRINSGSRVRAINTKSHHPSKTPFFGYHVLPFPSKREQQLTTGEPGTDNLKATAQ